MGEFKQVGFPVSEFAYKDLKAAYGENADKNEKSTLADYDNNVHFFAPQ
ncbi:MAG: hypothetical protein IJZ89_02730 [Clostridia bacterium]|nr:hypothetical protein [Clostridia bacterium]